MKFSIIILLTVVLLIPASVFGEFTGSANESIVFESKYDWEKDYQYGSMGIFIEGDVILNAPYSGQQIVINIQKPNGAMNLYDIIQLDPSAHYGFFLRDTSGYWPLGETKIELRNNLAHYTGVITIVEKISKEIDLNEIIPATAKADTATTEKKTAKYDFMIDYQCPSIDKFELVTDPNDSGKKIFVPTEEAEVSVTFARSALSSIPNDFKVLAYYSDGSVEESFSDFKGVVNIPQKNYDGTLMKFIMSGDGYNTSETKINCNYDNVDQEYLEKQHVKAEQIEKDNVEAQNYCTYLIDGCKPIYNIHYEINAPNDFVYKSWMEYNNIKEIKNISYDFHKINKNSFSYLESTHKKNGVSETLNVNEKFEFGSMFIPPKSPITETDEDLKVKRTNMNFAGMNRDVVHIEFSTSDKTILGFVDTNQKWYYDWNTGLLLKHEFQRTVLDVSGKTNSDKFVQEISAINFPKNDSKGGGCLIATATYGSEMSNEVQQLRELRDNQLLNTVSGTQFMGMFNDVYYSFSPIIADYERENPLFKEAVKLAITPMISSLSLIENAESESEVISLGLSVIMLNLGMYLGVPAVVIVGIRKSVF